MYSHGLLLTGEETDLALSGIELLIIFSCICHVVFTQAFDILLMVQLWSSILISLATFPGHLVGSRLELSLMIQGST